MGDQTIKRRKGLRGFAPDKEMEAATVVMPFHKKVNIGFCPLVMQKLGGGLSGREKKSLV